MVEFNSDIPKGKPQLPQDYWSKQNNNTENSMIKTIFDNNINNTLEDISIFKGKK